MTDPSVVKTWVEVAMFCVAVGFTATQRFCDSADRLLDLIERVRTVFTKRG